MSEAGSVVVEFEGVDGICTPVWALPMKCDELAMVKNCPARARFCILGDRGLQLVWVLELPAQAH